MNLTPEQMDELAAKVADEFRKNPPEILSISRVGRENAPVVQFPPEFYEFQTEVRQDIQTLGQEIKTLGLRLEDFMHQVDRRFEQIDKRFEQVDKRFEQVDKRFEQVDKRFDDLIHHMDKRFEAMDKRFNTMQWFVSLAFTLTVVLMTVYQFLG